MTVTTKYNVSDIVLFDGNKEEYLLLMDELGITGDIKLIDGYVPDREVEKYFSSTDLVVLPYESATQSGISSISWNFDVPLITTPVGGLVESVGKAGTGMLTDGLTPQDVARSIEKYFAENRKEEYLRNISRLKSELGWEAFAKKLEDFINTL